MRKVSIPHSGEIFWVIIALVLGIIFSLATRDMRSQWPGISDALTSSEALFYGAGDQQFSYRMVGSMLQNAGDTGGRVTNFRDYDYSVIEQWLWLADRLDHKANYVPSLAAYYFSAAEEPDKLHHLIGYLSFVGQDVENERWRWLAHAVYLARFNLNDQGLALELAYKLAALPAPNMPLWTKAMPAYVQKSAGNKKSARDLLLLLVANPAVRSEQADINQTCWYIEQYLREPGDQLEEDALFNDFCMSPLKKQGLTP